MRARKTWLFVALALAGMLLLALGAYWWASRQEPEYQGRKLTFWLDQLDDGDRSTVLAWEPWRPLFGPDQVRAQVAIRALNTNSLPILLEMIDNTNRDSAWRTNLVRVLRRQHWIKVSPATAADRRHQAMLAFYTLGSNAAPAVGTLTRIWDESRNCKEAASALAQTGPAGWRVLAGTLLGTNEDWRVACAVHALASRHVSAPQLTEMLLSRLQNTHDPAFKGLYILALEVTPRDTVGVVPALLAATRDKDKEVERLAREALERLQTSSQDNPPQLIY